MNTILTLLILSLPVFVEAFQDYRDYKAGVADKKTKDVIFLRLPLMIFLSGLNVVAFPNEYIFWLQWFQGFVLSLGLFFLLFDPLMGYLLVGNIRFLGTTSKSDSILGKMTWWQVFFLRFWVMAVAWGVYFNMDLIIG